MKNIIIIIFIFTISLSNNSSTIYKLSKKNNSMKLIDNFFRNLDYYNRASEIMLISNTKFVGDSLIENKKSLLRMSNQYKTFSSYDMEGYKIPSSEAKRGIVISYKPDTMLIGIYNLINWNYISKNEVQLDYFKKYTKNHKYSMKQFSTFGMEDIELNEVVGKTDLLKISTVSSEIQKGKILEANSSIFKSFYFNEYVNYIKPTAIPNPEITDIGKGKIKWASFDSSSSTLNESVDYINVNTILENEFIKTEIKIRPQLTDEDGIVSLTTILPDKYIYNVFDFSSSAYSMLDTSLSNISSFNKVLIEAREDYLKGYPADKDFTGIVPSNKFLDSYNLFFIK